MYIDIFIIMKKEQLTNLIREAVRAELKSFLPKMLKELNTVNEHSSDSADLVEVTRKSLKQVRADKPTKSKANYKTYSKNTAINDILNETVGGIPQQGGVSSGINEVTDFQGQSVDVEALPDHVSNALTRDYSAVLKAVDKKRGKTT